MMTTKKKTDPKAKVRNRGSVVFDDQHPKVNDGKAHFPINNINQARNALARASQYSKSPKWWKGSLQGLVSAVARAVHKKHPSIEISDNGKTPGKKEAGINAPPGFVDVLENLIRLRADNQEAYVAAVNTLKHKITLGENHNGWTFEQLGQLLKNIE